MAAVTVFSLETCPHCSRAKGVLQKRAVPYNTINLTDYPELRSAMIMLANRTTVPQIFVGNKHVGGATDLDAAIESGEFDALLESEKDAELDPGLSVPTYEPKPQPKASERTEGKIRVGDLEMTVVEATKFLQGSLEIKDRMHGFTKYHRCFVGKEAVDVLMAKLGLETREQAVEVGNVLYKNGLFHHVEFDHDFEDKHLFYRLQADSTPMVLNSLREWKDRVDNPQVVILNLKKKLDGLLNRHRDDQGLVDYIAAQQDNEFLEFDEATCEVQGIKLAEMEENDKLAFCINLYNLMILHAFAKIGTPTSNFQRNTFFSAVSYNVGGLQYSFNDLEHGVVRGNKPPPYKLFKPFSLDDPRIETIVKEPDPRIHFALNCGAKSCPAIKKFTSSAVKEELQVVSIGFFESDENCSVDIQTRTICLNKILNWYHGDFGDSNDEMLRFIAQFCSKEKQDNLLALVESKQYKLRYNEYDWTTDARRAKTLDKSEATTETTACSVS